MPPKIKVYQIGVGSFGRHSFEKLVDMHHHLGKVDLELAGVCDIHPEKLEIAKKYANTHDMELETFRDEEKMYEEAKEAQEQDEEIMIYDAGPSESHAEHIYKSINHGFFHLAEKPPSMKREERIHEKRLAKDKPFFWKVDFIERESPVVKKALDMIDDETNIDKIEIFRESTIAVQKILDPVHRSGVVGGDILDKMTHEIYVLDFLEKNGQRLNMNLEEANTKCFIPFKKNSSNFMTVKGGKTSSINERTCTGKTQAVLDNGETKVKLHSSWVGISKEASKIHEKHKNLAKDLIKSEINKENQKLFSNEEARFFRIKGSLNLLGDMLNGKLYDLDTGKEIETPKLAHDQLYRVIEKAVLEAVNERESALKEEEVDIFMNSIFDIKDEVTSEEHNVYEELTKAREAINKKFMEFKDFETDSPEEIKG